MKKIFLCLFVLLLCLPVRAGEGMAGQLRVLVINSYSADYSWSRSFQQGLREQLLLKYIPGASIYSQNLDARRFDYGAIKGEFAALLRRKYQAQNTPHVIVVNDDWAYRFMRELGQEIFPDIPVVFCGLDGASGEELRYAPYVTGVINSVPLIRDTLATAHTLFPEAEHLLLVADKTATGHELRRQTREVLSRSRFGFRSVEFFSPASIEEMERRCIALAPGTLVLYLLYTSDEEGKVYDVPEVTLRLSRSAGVPVFTVVSNSLGHGAVGGRVASSEILGREVADMVMRIAGGTPPDEIPLNDSVYMPYMFDARQLRRFGGDPSRLPAEAVVVNEDGGLREFYEEHRPLVRFVLLLLALQALSIAMLLINRGKLLRVRNELYGSRQLYRSLIDDPPVSICRYLVDGTLTFANRDFCRFLGRTEEEILGRRLSDFIPPAQVPLLEGVLASLTRESNVRRVEFEMTRQDGQTRYLRWINRAIFDHAGSLEVIQGIGEDITDLKLAYDVLIENEKRFRTVADFTSGLESWLSPAGEVLYINPGCEAVTGYTAREYRNNPELFLSTVYPEDRKFFEQRWQRPEREFSLQYRLVRKDGRILWLDLLCRPIHDQGGRFMGRRLSGRDITERKRAEDALRDNEENLRITLQSISDGVLSTDLSGCIGNVNSAGEDLLGLPLSELVGSDIEQMLHLELPCGGRVSGICEKVFSGEGIFGQEPFLVLRGAGGQSRKVSGAASAIRNSSGIVVGAVLVLRDISQQLELEQQLRHTQKMDAIGQLAGGVAHDFNNMLGGIIGAAELLLLHNKEQHVNTRYADIILTTAERASTLTAQLLDFARKGQEPRRAVDMHANIADAVDILRNTIDKRIRISTIFEAGDSVVLGDEAQLENVIINLCINARDAMPGGGTITIRSANLSLGHGCKQGASGWLPAGEYLCVEVEDNGHGIDPAIAEKIFDPFFTTKEVGKGTGLGLSAVYGIMRDHRGAVEVSSQPGVGACFTIFLPLKGAEHGEEPGYDPEHMQTGNGRILVVDDEPQIRQTACDILARCGYDVLEAQNGRAAVEIYMESAAGINLVLLDMVMPELGGGDTFRILREINPAARVLLCSGYARDGEVDALLAAGALDYIKKPYRMTELSLLVARVMRETVTKG